MNGYKYFIGKEIKFQEIKKHSYMVTQRLSEMSWSGDPAEAILLPHLLCKTQRGYMVMKAREFPCCISVFITNVGE